MKTYTFYEMLARWILLFAIFVLIDSRAYERGYRHGYERGAEYTVEKVKEILVESGHYNAQNTLANN